MKALPEYIVKAEVSIAVPAFDRTEAQEVAEQYLNRYSLAAQNVRVSHYDWKPAAYDMLEEGYSQSEVARELNVDRASVSKEFPGTGLTREDGLELGRLTAKMNQVVRDAALGLNYS